MGRTRISESGALRLGQRDTLRPNDTIGFCLLSTPYVAMCTIDFVGASARKARSGAAVPTRTEARAP